MNCKNTKAAIDSASRRNPINSETHVHVSGCSDCRNYSDQSNALLALLTSQPRVQAPTDFNFRLSARIARAQTEPTSPFAFLDNLLLGQTFSIKQAAASLAALMVMAAGTTLYFNQSNQQVSNSPMVASNIAPVVRPVVKPELPMPISTVAPAVGLSARSQGRVAAMKPAVLVQASASVAMDRASASDKVSVYNSEKGHVSKLPKGGIYFGAESSDQMARPASFGSF